jgi:hypothetical protein
MFDELKKILSPPRKTEQKKKISPQKKKKSVEIDKWIGLEISVVVTYSVLVKIKQALQPYAEELGWHIGQKEGTKDEEGVKWVPIVLIPLEKNKEKRYSPKEFLKERDKVMGIAHGVYEEFILKEQKEQELTTESFVLRLKKNPFLDAKKEGFYVYTRIGCLTMNYPIQKRLELEKENKKLYEEIFVGTTQEQISEIFQISESKLDEATVSIKKDLVKLFGFKL